MNDIPIIRLEVERMKATILTALSQHAVQMDTYVRAAIDSYCTAENITVIIDEAVERELSAAVKEEVKRFFSYGHPGREAVRLAIAEKLLPRTPPAERKEFL